MALQIDWSWIGDHTGAIVTRLTQHLQLTILPVLFGFAISLALGIWASRHGRTYGPITAIAGLLYTVPSLAAFAFLVPLTGFSLLTPLIPLTTYTFLILFRAIVGGLHSVPADVLEAAEGMGYTRRERLIRVELPLAVPLMMAGIRLATVTTIGLATIAAILGETFGGLGFFLTEGFQRYFATEIYLGAVLSIALAVTADVVLVRVERFVTPWARSRVGVV